MGGVFEKPETRLVCVYNVTDGSVNTTIVPSSKASNILFQQESMLSRLC